MHIIWLFVEKNSITSRENFIFNTLNVKKKCLISEYQNKNVEQESIKYFSQKKKTSHILLQISILESNI